MNKQDEVFLMHVVMMDLTGGKERTLDELDILLKEGGFCRTKKPIPFGMN